jgi:hypothetical protein
MVLFRSASSGINTNWVLRRWNNVLLRKSAPLESSAYVIATSVRVNEPMIGFGTTIAGGATAKIPNQDSSMDASAMSHHTIP